MRAHAAPELPPVAARRVGIVGQLDVCLCFDEGQNLLLDELGVSAGHGVVLEAALAALRVAAAVADGDADHDGQLVRGDE